MRVGAVLKEGSYRSASSYLGLYRANAERAGHEISGPMARARKAWPPLVSVVLARGAQSMGLPMAEAMGMRPGGGNGGDTGASLARL